ncbi:MAG: hypothetical protein CSB48_10150 [Proteobacteria bacterium]|nr:MAG: hypothetical protein CSB48_10150 [Pseudomonadota bacterium]
MALRAIIKNIIQRIDMLSPHPFFYPFVMSRDEKIAFDEAIGKSGNYLEFGLGGSTLRALQRSEAKIYTVESSPEWIGHMRKYFILRRSENKRLHIFPVNIGPTGDWGYPEPGNDPDLFAAYSSSVFDSIDRKSIDLVLVDGRFRVACILKIILSCHDNQQLNILIHDFWNRQQYHVVLKYLDVIKKVDSLGVFSIKDDIDMESVQKDYESYKLDPE